VGAWKAQQWCKYFQAMTKYPSIQNFLLASWCLCGTSM
jgi:hypothetical protein